MTLVHRQEWEKVRVGRRSFAVSVEWDGEVCYSTTYVKGAPLGLPVRCESVEMARAVAAKRLKAYQNFLDLR
ncbi:MAG: hypothetical protein JRM86_05315 [Nitrososphaerota archaeon]|nr:hypothetical protein [Nitrososphaerota archaeon]MDG6966353.1 hypothetical protein [Nitrososphaerota archaeon]MDG6977788.1 hypothetical protein [Nitrososphaerota archaeon]MDG7006335.1 hypothetical protein [Nitrososphaerota archaeon]MDG7020857.1 hypothetical protein [Nitrososphaerota archaeon]